MPEQIPRKACDRCHAQKLSCRRIGDSACARCQRLKAQCVFSPSLRGRKQSKRQTKTCVATSPLTAHASDVGHAHTGSLDWLDNESSTFDPLNFNLDNFSLPYSSTNNFTFGHSDSTSPIHHEKPDQTTAPIKRRFPFFHDPPNFNVLWPLDSNNTPSTPTLTQNVEPATVVDGEDDETGSDTTAVSPYLTESQPASGINGRDILPNLLTPAATSEFNNTAASSPVAKQQDSQPNSAQLKIENDRTWIKRLADINIKLFEHAATAPTPSSNPNRSANTSANSNADIQNAAPKPTVPIDVTVELSRDLLVLLTEICTPPPITNNGQSYQPRLPARTKCASSCRASSSTTLHTPDSNDLQFHPPTQPATAYSSSSPPHDRTPHSVLLPDTGSTLLILSSYTRILDIYSRFFTLISTALSSSLSSSFYRSISTSQSTGSAHPDPLHLTNQIELPTFTIGSLSLHNSPALQITLLIRLVEEVLERLRGVLAHVRGSAAEGEGRDGGDEGERVHGARELLDGRDRGGCGGGGSDGVDGGGLGVSEATLLATRRREAGVYRKMNEVRRMVQRLEGF